MVEFWTKKSVWVNLTSGATFHFSSSAKIEFGKSQIRFLFFTNLSCLSHKSLGFSRPHFDLERGSDALARAFVNPWLAAEKYKVEYVNAFKCYEQRYNDNWQNFKGGLFVETRKATAECIVLQFQPSCKLSSTVQCSAQQRAFFVNFIIFPYEREGASRAVNFRWLKKCKNFKIFQKKSRNGGLHCLRAQMAAGRFWNGCSGVFLRWILRDLPIQAFHVGKKQKRMRG